MVRIRRDKRWKERGACTPGKKCFADSGEIFNQQIKNKAKTCADAVHFFFLGTSIHNGSVPLTSFGLDLGMCPCTVLSKHN